MKTMRAILFALVAAFAVSGNSFAVTALGAGTYGIQNFSAPAGTSFDDGYAFDVLSLSQFESNTAASSTFTGSNLDSLSSALYGNWTGNAGTSTLLASDIGTADGNGSFTSTLNFSPLVTGTTGYALIVSGHVASTALNELGGYGGTFTISPIPEPGVTSPIPEPEIYGMLGAGLALMGWVGRRRKVQLAA